MHTHTQKIGIGETADVVQDVACIRCRRQTKHRVLTSVDVTDEMFDLYYDHSSNYQVVQCQGCEEISFQMINRRPYDGREADYCIDYDVYPERKKNVPIDDAHFLPLDVQRIYLETVEANNNNLSILVGIGIRAIIETICVDKNTSGNNLLCRINDLVKIGVLTSEGAEILHKMRSMGNDSAHKVKVHDKNQLVLALNVVEHLLRGVYILPIQTKQTFK